MTSLSTPARSIRLDAAGFRTPAAALRGWAPTVVALSATAVLMALTAPPADAAASPARPARPTEMTAPRTAGDPIMAIVSIKSQKVTFYDTDGWIVSAPVSTGTTGRETPAGVFAVVEKDKDHHSSLYDDAWMPNMLRITWNGIALHGGPLPGYAASHGCVRMPFDFAAKMFDKAPMGMRVIISPTDAEPVAFSDPSLFVPKQDAIDAIPARADALARDADDATKAAAAAKAAVVTAKRDAAAAPAAVRNLAFLKQRADAELAYAGKVLAVAKNSQTKADQFEAMVQDVEQKAAAKAEELGTQPDAATADVAPPDAKAKQNAIAAAQAAANAEKMLAAAKNNQAKAGQAEATAQDVQQKAAAKADALGTQLDAAKTDAKAKQDAVAAAAAAAKTAEAKRVETAKVAMDAKLAGEPVSIYISRATQKLYVRRDTHKKWPDGGELYDFSQEFPVTIKDPGKPLGTHIFTAVARAEGGLRWTEVSIDNSDSAKDALDRVTFPQEVLDRIAPTALPLSSIIISDEPLSAETNYRTEFVAVLNNQPQGGFITRLPSPKVDVANNQNDSGFGHWFGSFGNTQPAPPPSQPSRQTARGQSYYPSRSW